MPTPPPTQRRRSRVAVVLAALLLAVGVVAIAPSSAVAKGNHQATGLSGLKVLLTNDDSMQAVRASNTDGLGLYEVRKALCAAGADVVVIAPWGSQSGKGSAVTNSGTFRLGQKALPSGYESDCASAPSGGQVYGLCTGTAPCSPASGSATPADTVMFALRAGLAAVAGWHEPDLVVSGSNSGANVASSVNDSGPVGAAATALADGLPAVAFSSSNAPDFSMPAANYRATAEWGATFLTDLNARGLLLQNEFLLNVNYPDTSSGARAGGPVWAVTGDATVAYHGYTLQPDGSYTIGLSLCSGLPICEETRKKADWIAVMQKSQITVVPLTWDRTVGISDRSRTLAQVRSFVERYGRG